MSDLNIIMVDDDQLAEIYTALKQTGIMLQSYNKMCVNARDIHFQRGEDNLAKEVESYMEEVDKRMERIGVFLQAIEK